MSIITKEIIRILEDIETLEYSEQDGLIHRGDIGRYIMDIIRYPKCPYIIVDLNNIPKWVRNSEALMKLLKIKKPEEIDFSKLLCDIPELGLYKHRK